MSAKSQVIELQLFYSTLNLLETSNLLNKQAMTMYQPERAGSISHIATSSVAPVTGYKSFLSFFFSRDEQG